jgi:hypothetical protein
VEDNYGVHCLVNSGQFMPVNFGEGPGQNTVDVTQAFLKVFHVHFILNSMILAFYSISLLIVFLTCACGIRWKDSEQNWGNLGSIVG